MTFLLQFLHNSVTEREAVLQKAMLLKATVMTRNNEAKRLPVDSNTTVLRKAVTLLQEVMNSHFIPLAIVSVPRNNGNLSP